MSYLRSRKEGRRGQKAQRLAVGELKKRGWTEKVLEGRQTTDDLKVKMAVRLRAESVMTVDWIAQRLRLGCWHTVATCLKKRSPILQ